MRDNGRGQAYFNSIWYGGAGGAWLRPLAALYALIIGLRRGLYALGVLRTTRVPVPVIVIGNLTVGGTGKTPLTAFLARELTARGFRPGIASRGHGGSGKQARRVLPESRAEEVGDEPLLLSRATGVPVCVAARRAAAAGLLVAAGCDIVLCDDGLQHLALARDLAIAVVDGSRGLGNGRLLPAGPLRESPSRLGSVDLVVINDSAPGPSFFQFPAALRMRLAGDEAVSLTGLFANRPLSGFRGQVVHAVAAIGNPDRFFAGLRQAGLEVIEHPFPDHHVFTAGDLRFGDERQVLMTEKDAVKCSAIGDQHHWYVPVDAVFDPVDARRLLDSIAGLSRLRERSDA